MDYTELSGARLDADRIYKIEGRSWTSADCVVMLNSDRKDDCFPRSECQVRSQRCHNMGVHEITAEAMSANSVRRLLAHFLRSDGTI